MKKIIAIIIIVLGAVACSIYLSVHNAKVIAENEKIQATREVLYEIQRKISYRKSHPGYFSSRRAFSGLRSIPGFVVSGGEEDSDEEIEKKIVDENFTVETPYIVLHDEHSRLIDYSGGPVLTKQAGDKVKILVYVHHAFVKEKLYNIVKVWFWESPKNGTYTGKQSSVRNFDAELYYYDMENGTFLGYEVLSAPPLGETVGTDNLRHSDKTIRAAVKAHKAR